MNNRMGIMQGRLLPKYHGRYQAHPVGYWQDEFPKAAELGLDCIEFILDYNDAEQNPLMSSKGIKDILYVSKNSGVQVKTICADYFMEAPLHSSSKEIVQESQKVLKTLIHHGVQLGISDIVIPCVDQSSLVDEEAKQRFIENILSSIKLAEKAKINLSLETDLAPIPFLELLKQLGHSRITVNYDTGNSASLGYDPEEELSTYGSYISDVHIKDRTYKGGSVILGTGDTKFESFFRALSIVNYQGPFILQAYRDDEGKAIFKKQLAWIKQYIETLSQKTIAARQ
jgi:L-ribulose-5-phosphate 3-epimerase